MLMNDLSVLQFKERRHLIAESWYELLFVAPTFLKSIMLDIIDCLRYIYIKYVASFYLTQSLNGFHVCN